MPATLPEQLIIRHLSGSISPEETHVFHSWLNENPENKKIFEEYRQVWALSSPNAASPDFQTRQEWQRLEITLDELDQPAAKERSLSGNKGWYLKIAASTTLLLLCAALTIYLLNQDEALITRESGGEEIHFALSDGTEVWLNKGSTLSYAREFGTAERVVHLKGEAFFQVTHNPVKPFLVMAEQAKVKVLGTSFNVKARRQDPVAEVLVVTGKVSLATTEADNQEVVLLAGERGVLLKARQLVLREPVKDLNRLAWRENKLVFRKTALGEVIDTLEEYFDIQLTVANSELLHCRITSSFDDPQLEEVLEVLRHSLNIRISGEGNAFELEGKGCNAEGV
jgi:transmembrane sensor